MHFLAIKAEGRYLDATLGGGGHATEIIRRGGYVLGLDQDAEAINYCQTTYSALIANKQLTCVQKNFLHLSDAVRQQQWPKLDGVLFDLGVSSHQFDIPERGFSFQKEGPLDMRMDQTLPNSAATLVNQLPGENLAQIIRNFGEEPQAKALAAAIVAGRPIKSTTQLASLIGNPERSRRIFQALRIAVNDELGALETALPQALSLLKPEGRLVVISFHSLEDRIVKNTFRDWSAAKKGVILTHHSIQPAAEEIAANSRAKSAKLRAFVKS